MSGEAKRKRRPKAPDSRMVRIATAFGPMEVPVLYRRGGLAVTQKMADGALSASAFVISHERSGLKVPRVSFGSIESAKRALLEVLKVADWRKTTGQLMRRKGLGEEVYAAIRLADAKRKPTR